MGARWDQSEKILDAVAATTSQTSVAIKRRPSGAQGILLSIDVTAGAVLLLDLGVEVYSEALEAWVGIENNVPSAGGITGVSTTHATIGPFTASDSNIDHRNLQLLPKMRINVDHGNATAATYAVYAQWF